MGNIKSHKVIKETAKQLTFEERDWNDKVYRVTEPKETKYHRWFDTWQEAKDWLVSEAEKDVEGARRVLQAAHDRLGNAKGLKEPKESP